jgi:DNA-binding CsgD family transcriptional regulator
MQLWALDHLGLPAVLVNSEGTVLEHTQAAAQLAAHDFSGFSPTEPPRLLTLGGAQWLVESWPAAPHHLVTFTPPNWSASSKLRKLSALYRLTDGEIKTLTEILRHGSIQAAVATKALNRNTAKSQLASMFNKTGTKRTSQLLLLFSRLTIFPGADLP